MRHNQPGNLAKGIYRPFALLTLSLFWFNLAFIGSAFTAKADNSLYFPETNHTVSGKFLTYWQQNGGLSTYGYPITDPQNEVDPETGKTFLTQWFERNRFELHPENAGTRFEVLLGLLGKDLRREALKVDQEFLPTVSYSGVDQPQRFFSETYHNLSGKFLVYWQNNGSLARFGFPISEQHFEVDPETGQSFLSQWFERARFELHPENQPPYDVLLGLLGNQIKRPKATPLQFNWRLEKSDGLLHSQFGTVVDSKGNVYLAADDEYVSRHHNTSEERPSRIFKFDSQGQLVARWGSQGSGDGQFSVLDGLAIDSHDNIYAGDYKSGRVQKFDSNGNFLLKWGSQGNGDGQFQNASALTADSAGNVYVLDSAANRVQKFDSNGNFLLKWGSQGSGDGQFDNPRSLSVDETGNLYVADTGNFRVQKFDSNGQFLLKWGSKGREDGKFGYVGYVDHTPDYGGPVSIISDKKGQVYVTDWGNFRIEKFDATGIFLQSWTHVSDFNPNLYPRLALGADGGIYLAADNRVEKYSSDKTLLGKWAYVYHGLDVVDLARIRTDAQGFLYAFGYTEPDYRLIKISPSGQIVGGFDIDAKTCQPSDMAIAQSGNIYIACQNTVKVFNNTGQILESWGSQGNGNGQFNRASVIALDRDGNVYVADDNRRIQKFDSHGQFLTGWAVKSSDNTRQLLPADIVVDSHNSLFVSVVETEQLINNYDTQGNFLGNITSVLARDMGVDGHDNLLVNAGDHITKISKGKVVWSYATTDRGDGSTIDTRTIAVDKEGNVYLQGGFEVKGIQKLHEVD